MVLTPTIPWTAVLTSGAMLMYLDKVVASNDNTQSERTIDYHDQVKRFVEKYKVDDLFGCHNGRYESVKALNDFSHTCM